MSSVEGNEDNLIHLRNLDTVFLGLPVPLSFYFVIVFSFSHLVLLTYRFIFTHTKRVIIV